MVCRLLKTKATRRILPSSLGLVQKGLLIVAAGFRHGLSKLIPEKDVHRFAEQYVVTSALAKRFGLNSVSFTCHLKKSGTPLLAIPIPDVGKGFAFFLSKDVAAQIRLPNRTRIGCRTGPGC
jgi:hypothetical protein